MEDKHETLTPRQLESRRENAQKSTGPRTPAGRRRSALNALKYGGYSGPHTMEQTMFLLGEDPREFHAFRNNLIAARRPADEVERMLVEDIAMLAWKKRRLDRAQNGLQLRNLEVLELGRQRQALEVGRESADVSQEDVLKSGLRRAPKSPAKFGEILSQLDIIAALVKKGNFSEDIRPVIAMLYGESPTLRGAEIANIYRQLGDEGVETEEARELLAGLKLAIEEETRDVMEEYALFLQEYVDVSPALRDSMLAPAHPQWTAMIRHEHSLDRQIERKLKLLTQIQRARKIQERVAQEAEQRAQKEKKNSFLAKRTGEVIENEESAHGNGTKRTEKRSGEVVENKRVHKKRTGTNRKTNRAKLLKTHNGKISLDNKMPGFAAPDSGAR